MERCFEVAALPEQFGWRKLSVQRGLQQLLREILALTQPEHELRGGRKRLGGRSRSRGGTGRNHFGSGGSDFCRRSFLLPHDDQINACRKAAEL